MRLDITVGILSVAVSAAPIASWFSRETSANNKKLRLEGNIEGCSVLDGMAKRTIFDQQTFEFLRSIYKHSILEDTKGSMDAPGGGFNVPFEVLQVPGKGRGVFAKERIPRNTLIWQGSHYAEFRDEESFLLFMSSIASNFELSCDILQWAYVGDFYRGDYHVGLDLDEGSYVNHGEPSQVNIGCNSGILLENPDVNDPDCWGEYALRDIEAGEELIVDYTEFYHFGKLPWFDKIVSEAWENDAYDEGVESKSSARWHYR